MKVVFIGAGNVATHLAQALQGQGYDICQVYSRTDASAKTLAALLHTAYTSDIAAIDREADIYIYSVSDSVLPEIAGKLGVPGALHIHTSGSTDMNVFQGYADYYGVLYPLQTFSKNKSVDFSVIPLLCEANNDFAKERLLAMASCLSESIYPCDSESRRKLHLSAVFVCNFVNHLYEVGAELAGDSGLPVEVLYPLIQETADKIKSLSPYEAQTGPAVRNDRNIIDKHLAMLEGKRNLSGLYEMLSEDIFSVHRITSNNKK